ncbi:MAG: STAS domain-containing protein [Candidatus Hydrogenedentes bacterium]|nr:STAS domain-containing protein [Candidatus Hydrogenedentota bacterium]
MNVHRLESGAVTVLRPVGDLDEEGAKDLRLSLGGCLQDQRARLVVNLTDVNFVSYLGLGLLVECLRQFRACRGDLRLAGVNLYTRRIMRMAGILHLFEIYEDETVAIDSYRKAA